MKGITVRKSDGYYVVRDEHTMVTTQGKTRLGALKNLVDALELYYELEL